jgi:hypothetical protein
MLDLDFSDILSSKRHKGHSKDPVFEEIHASDNVIECLTVLLIVVGMTITHDTINGFLRMDTLNPSK